MKLAGGAVGIMGNQTAPSDSMISSRYDRFRPSAAPLRGGGGGERGTRARSSGELRHAGARLQECAGCMRGGEGADLVGLLGRGGRCGRLARVGWRTQGRREAAEAYHRRTSPAAAHELLRRRSRARRSRTGPGASATAHAACLRHECVECWPLHSCPLTCLCSWSGIL